MPPLTEAQFQELAAALLARVRASAPDWTETNDSDPGITLLQLFAFVTESLLYRQNQIPPGAARVAQRLERAARALTGGAQPRADCGLTRPNYFAGQILTAEDLAEEQDYFRTRLRRGNRLLVGSGVVSGLGVAVEPDSGGQGQAVVVEPGFALDPAGEEIEVCERTRAALPSQGNRLLVQLLFVERPSAPVPASGASSTGTPDGEQRFARVEETFTIVMTPAARTDAVPVARLAFARGRWSVDRRFIPPRASR